MGGSSSYKRHAWEDQFKVPTDKDLRDGYPNKQNAALFEQARSALKELPGVTEKLVWQGVPWCWTFVYENGCQDGAPAAMLVPDHAMPKVIVPLPHGTFAAVNLSSLPADMRVTVDHSRSVCGSAWPAFEITGKGRLDLVITVVKSRITAGHAKRNGQSVKPPVGFIPPYPMR